MNTTTTKILRVAAVNDEVTTCMCCGRVDLKKTVLLVDSDGQAVGRFGVVCAAHKLGWSKAKSKARIEQRMSQEAVEVALELMAASRKAAVESGALVLVEVPTKTSSTGFWSYYIAAENVTPGVRNGSRSELIHARKRTIQKFPECFPKN